MSEINSINEEQYFEHFHDYSKVFGFDFTNTKAIDSIIEKSVTDLVTRNDIKYLPKMQTPFTGWMAKFHKSGLIKSVQEYVRGVRHGASVQWLDQDGELFFKSAYSYKNNKRDGACVVASEYLEFINEGFMRNGLKEGKWLEEDKIECEYKNGKLNGKYKWENSLGEDLDEESSIYNVFNYLDKLKEEPKILSKFGIYENNSRTGEWCFSLNDGFDLDLYEFVSYLSIIGNYKNNTPNGHWELNSNGITLEEGKMINGKKTGTWIINSDSDDPIFNRY